MKRDDALASQGAEAVAADKDAKDVQSENSSAEGAPGVAWHKQLGTMRKEVFDEALLVFPFETSLVELKENSDETLLTESRGVLKDDVKKAHGGDHQ